MTKKVNQYETSSNATIAPPGPSRRKAIVNNTKMWADGYMHDAKMTFYAMAVKKIGGPDKEHMFAAHDGGVRVSEIGRAIYDDWLKTFPRVPRMWEAAEFKRTGTKKKWRFGIIRDRLDKMFYIHDSRKGLKGRGYSCEHPTRPYLLISIGNMTTHIRSLSHAKQEGVETIRAKPH